MAIQGFKKGDYLVPLKNRKRSKDMDLTTLIKVKVVSEEEKEWSDSRKYKIKVAILDGYSRNTYYDRGISKKNQIIEVYSDAFEKVDKVSPMYSIF